MASAHFPKFVLRRRTFFRELRKVMGTSKLINSSAAFLFEVQEANSPLVVQELQIGGTSIARRVFAAAIALAALFPHGARAAESLKEIRMDWATYNPVSLILKQKGMLEKEFAHDGIRIVWVQSPALRNSSALLEPADCNPPTASASSGCSRRVPTRRSNFSTPARSISARPRAPRRWSPESTAIRSNRSMCFRAPNGRRW